MMLIGLTGYAGVGKDEAAEALMQNLMFLGYSFAAPIRAGVAAAFGLEIDDFYDRERKERVVEGIGKSPRELMQLFGTEFGRRMLGDDIWIRVAETMYQGAKAAPEYAGTIQGVVISDVRFPNEADWIRGHGGKVIRIERPGVGPVNGHVSEAGLPDDLVDYTLVNSGTLDDLWSRTVEMVTAIMSEHGA